MIINGIIGLVNDESRENQLLQIGFLGLRTAQHRFDTRYQLFIIKRLDDIIVRSQLQSQYLVKGLSLGCQKDHRYRSLFPNLPASLISVHLRHHHIQNDEVEPPLPGQLQRRRAVIGALHLVALVFQVEFHTLYQGLFVIHH